MVNQHFAKKKKKAELKVQYCVFCTAELMQFDKKKIENGPFVAGRTSQMNLCDCLMTLI